MNKFLEHKYTLPAVLLIALLLRLIPAICALSDDSRLLRPDSMGYIEPAKALAENGSYPTTVRPPGYPLLAASVYACGMDNTALVIVQVLISTAACAATAAAASAYAGKKCGVIAAIFMACNITAIANAPLLLSDTLFSLFAALQFYFFIRYWRSGKLKYLLSCTLLAATGTLIRPINQLMMPVLIFMVLIMPQTPWKKKILHALYTLLLFTAVITPWMYRNYRYGSTFDIDSNTGAMRHQNGAMLMAKVNGTDFETEKQRLLAQERAEFSNRGKHVTAREKEQWRKDEFRKMVKQYPFTYFMQHFDLRILLPDVPSFLENFGLTSSDRGTMGVLKKDGIFAAVKHYFGDNWLLYLLLTVPLLLPVMLLYAGAFYQLVKDLIHIKSWSTAGMGVMIFMAFAEYYLFLPGSITAPRYQLPALPCLCTLAAFAAINLLQKKNAADTEKISDTEKM